MRQSLKTCVYVKQIGFSLIEMVVSLGILATALGVAAANYRSLSSDIQNATTQTSGFIKQVRARAISATVAYRIETTDDRHLVAKFSQSCNDNATDFAVDSRLFVELPQDTQISPITDLCFTPRGLSLFDTLITISLRDGTQSRQLELGLAGAVKIHKTEG